jgi:hypothetical protein
MIALSMKQQCSASIVSKMEITRVIDSRNSRVVVGIVIAAIVMPLLPLDSV